MSTEILAPAMVPAVDEPTGKYSRYLFMAEGGAPEILDVHQLIDQHVTEQSITITKIVDSAGNVADVTVSDVNEGIEWEISQGDGFLVEYVCYYDATRQLATAKQLYLAYPFDLP